MEYDMTRRDAVLRQLMATANSLGYEVLDQGSFEANRDNLANVIRHLEPTEVVPVFDGDLTLETLGLPSDRVTVYDAATVPQCLRMEDYDDGETLDWDNVTQVILVPSGVPLETMGLVDVHFGDFSAVYVSDWGDVDFDEFVEVG